MMTRRQFDRMWQGAVVALGVLLLAVVSMHAQAPVTPVAPPVSTPKSDAVPPAPVAPVSKPAKSDALPTPTPKPVLPSMPPVQGSTLDNVVAIVNGDLVLDSDVDQERRFQALIPYGEAGGSYARDRAIERLINRDLILQQSSLQPENAVSDADAEKDLKTLRTELPACKQYHCDTAEGWKKFLATQGFTPDSLRERWRQRMEVLGFIEQRFRMGIKITPQQVQEYYNTTLRRQFAAQHATAPALAETESRIEEILLQQQVSALLDDWLKSLKAQGSVVLLHPGEDAP